MSLQSLEESIVRSSLNRIRGRDGASRDGERDALFVLFAINRSGDAPFVWRLRLAAVAEDAPRHDQDEIEDYDDADDAGYKARLDWQVTFTVYLPNRF